MMGAKVNWQIILTVAILALAAAYVVRAILRPILGRAGSAGCGSGCGKCAEPAAPPPGRIGLPQV